MAPLDEVGGHGVEEELAEDGAVDFRADVLLARPVPFPETLSALAPKMEVELPGAVVDPLLLAFWMGVLVERGLEAVLAQRALAALPSEVEGAAEVRAGVDVGVALVDGGGDPAAVEGQEEGEAA